jgi:2-C-methyl-D-erythritol 4-phosphate cytidylyltransferase
MSGSQSHQYTVIVPAAGVGKRMLTDRPKQYLPLAGLTVLEQTLLGLIAHPQIKHVVLALDPADPYFDTLDISIAPWLTRVNGGKERADSVLAGLQSDKLTDWVLVHDAARPCLSHKDLDSLLQLAPLGSCGGILATPVRDTMKRESVLQMGNIAHTENREGLWHALTPQFFPTKALREALTQALQAGVSITDEASAMEYMGASVKLIEGDASNIKITRPADLALAEFYFTQRKAQ